MKNVRYTKTEIILPYCEYNQKKGYTNEVRI